MGAAVRYRKKFLKAHPRCAFCAGKAAATTIEHCLPRAMFQHRLWPEGFEFPSCEPCNQGSDNDDLLVAMLARMDPFELNGDLDGKQIGLMKAVNQQFPGLFEEMKLSAAEARRSNRELRVHPTPGQTHQEVGVVKVPEKLHQAVRVSLEGHLLSGGWQAVSGRWLSASELVYKCRHSSYRQLSCF